jgi:hypothetical protein
MVQLVRARQRQTAVLRELAVNHVFDPEHYKDKFAGRPAYSDMRM